MVAGSEDKLAELRAVLERGSRGSRVDAVQESEHGRSHGRKPGIVPD